MRKLVFKEIMLLTKCHSTINGRARIHTSELGFLALVIYGALALSF